MVIWFHTFSWRVFPLFEGVAVNSGWMAGGRSPTGGGQEEYPCPQKAWEAPEGPQAWPTYRRTVWVREAFGLHFLSAWSMWKSRWVSSLWLEVPEHFTIFPLNAYHFCSFDVRYILEGKELEFYMKKLQRKKGKAAGASAWLFCIYLSFSSHLWTDPVRRFHFWQSTIYKVLYSDIILLELLWLLAWSIFVRSFAF